MNLALFDFDGTISSRDSFLLFLWYAGKKDVIKTCFSHIPQIVLFKLRRYPNQQLKEIFLKQSFCGRTIAELEQLAESFCHNVIPHIIRDPFWQKLEWHKQRNDQIVVVTASTSFILEPWCRTHRIEIIGSRLETDRSNRVTGRLLGNNCMGTEKVKRIQERYNLSAYKEIFAYGDTKSDFPMLELADSDKRFYKPFR